MSKNVKNIYLAIILSYALLCVWCVVQALLTPTTDEPYYVQDGE